MKSATKCPKCGGAVSAPGKAGGRPSRFCSEGCKASAEAEMRRVNTLLRKFEERRAAEVLRVIENVVAGVHREKRIAEVHANHDRVIAERQARYDHLAGVPARHETGS